MGPRHLRSLLLAGLCALAGAWPAGAAAGGTPGRLIVFGDSLSDPGNAFVLLRDVEVPPFELVPDAPYARGGLHFSNGATWVEQLAGALGAPNSAGPALLAPRAFSNYAVGAARARAAGPFHLTVQVERFLDDSGGAAPADALYVVFFGSNDLRDALEALALDPTGALSAMIVQDALGAIRDNLVTLYAAGARHFLVPNAPNIALAPAVRREGPFVQAAADLLVAGFNAGLDAILDGLEAGVGVSTARVDVYALLADVVGAPATYGFSEVTQPCITPGTRVQPYCAAPDGYLFWDGIHPTRAAHQLLAGRAGAALGLDAQPAAYAVRP
jgi:phospholipase/lecithinase/hemolysin